MYCNEGDKQTLSYLSAIENRRRKEEKTKYIKESARYLFIWERSTDGWSWRWDNHLLPFYTTPEWKRKEEERCREHCSPNGLPSPSGGRFSFFFFQKGFFFFFFLVNTWIHPTHANNFFFLPPQTFNYFKIFERKINKGLTSFSEFCFACLAFRVIDCLLCIITPKWTAASLPFSLKIVGPSVFLESTRSRKLSLIFPSARLLLNYEQEPTECTIPNELLVNDHRHARKPHNTWAYQILYFSFFFTRIFMIIMS